MGSEFSGGVVMRRILQGLCAFVFLFALAFPLQDVSAKPNYVDDAQNYLIWDTGNRYGSAVDLSSAIVVKDTPEYIIVAAFDYLVNYGNPAGGLKHSLTSKGIVYFKEYKQIAHLYYAHDSNSMYKKREWYKITSGFLLMDHAYPIIKERAIQNTKKISS